MMATDKNSTNGSAPSPVGGAADRTWTKGFWALAALQFQTGLAGYMFIHVLALLFLRAGGRGLEEISRPYTWLAFVYAIPFLAISGYAGMFANRLSKRFVILLAKMLEAGALALALPATMFLGGGPSAPIDLYVMTAALFVGAVHAVLYSPCKYGILAEFVPPERLSWANGMLETATFLSVPAGFALGQSLFVLYGIPGETHWIVAVLLGLSLAGLGIGSFVPRVDPAASGGKLKGKLKTSLMAEVWRGARATMTDRVAMLTALGVAAFWSMGSVMLANAARWAREDLGIEPPAIDALLGYFSSPMLMTGLAAVGCALGCVLAAMLTRKGPELGFVPLGGLGVAFFALPLGLAAPGIGPGGEIIASPILALLILNLSLILTGLCAGLYLVPLNAQLQLKVAPEMRGGAMAAVNFLGVVLTLVWVAVYWVLLKLFHFSAAHVFTLCSLLVFFGTVFLVTILPEALLALVRTVVCRFIYRIKRPVLGADNIPAEGPALLLCNHVSMVDALLILSISPRPVRFIVWKEIFDNPVLGYFLKIMHAIPVSSDQRPRALIASLGKASEALNNGEVVCVFSEGQISRAGLLLPGRRGFKHILEKAPAPVVPIYIEGVSKGIFGYERKRYRWRMPRKFRYDVRIAIGKPLAPDTTIHEIRQAHQLLSADCAIAKRADLPPVHHRFVRYARSNWRDFCLADSTTDYEPPESRKKRTLKQRFFGPKDPAETKEKKKAPANPPRNFGATLIGAIIVARRLRKHWKGQDMVGIFLPPAVAAVVTNVAAALAGRTAVNLNYTVGRDVLDHCIKTCNIRTIVTSKLFVTRIGLKDLPNCIYLEDLLKAKPPSLIEKLAAFVACHFFPIRMLESFCGCEKHPTSDSILTVIFSSGSTGVPKGVVLTHGNIASNIESFERAIALWPDDKMMGFLPLFHSFGYTAAMWGSLCIGYGVVHHNNPLEAKVIGDLVEKYKITLMIATPTFLQQYTRRVEPEKFQSVEYVLTGAEKLQLRVAEAFEERFGIYVYEGYGTSECAPVVSANIDDYRTRGHYTVSNKRGTVGRPCPGIAVRITDVDTGVVLPANTVGMIEIRGGNVMREYLNLPEKTSEALRDGEWYVTGDLGLIDDDGFIRITDRLARFSKIGGEMVPHVKIEEELHKACDVQDQTFAVTAIPDENKGERLIVLHLADEDRIPELCEKLAESGMPNLWIPRKNSFFKIDEIPVLGTGKLDLARIRALAKELASAEKAVAEAKD